MGFKAIDEYIEDYIDLPVPDRDGGQHVYRIREVSAETGLYVQQVMRVAAKVAAKGRDDITADDVDGLELDDDQERDLMSLLLGDVLEQMVADRVGWSMIQRVNATVMLWVAGGREQAERFWNSGGQAPGKAPKAPQDRKAPARAARPASTGGTNPKKRAAAGSRSSTS